MLSTKISHLSKKEKISQVVAPEETFIFFSICVLFTSIPVPVALEVINRKFTEHIDKKGTKHFHENTCLISMDEALSLSLLELVLNNCVFSFKRKFYLQLWVAAIGSPVPPVIADISMVYFEELALGSECPIPTPLWKNVGMMLSA